MVKGTTFPPRKARHRKRSRKAWRLWAAAALLATVALWAVLSGEPQRWLAAVIEDDPGSGHDTQNGAGFEPPDDEPAADGQETNPEDDGSETVTLAFVGDVMMAGNVGKLALDKGYDYPFELVGELLRAPDFTAANLETPITERGEPMDKEWVYRTSPDAVPAFVNAGIDLFSLANNHILDYGRVGLADTFANLENASLRYVGAGRTEEEAYAPVIVELNGIRVAFLGFSRVISDVSWRAGPNESGVASTYETRLPLAAVEAAASEADLVVVLVHWGKERESKPNTIQVDLGRRYIDAGADLVIGSHPHVLQGIEHYRGKWIAYSLGNFVFTTNPNPKTWDSVILQATCRKQGDCELEAVPILNAYAHPEPLEGEERLRILRELSSLSLNAAVLDSGKVAANTNNEEWEWDEP